MSDDARVKAIVEAVVARLAREGSIPGAGLPTHPTNPTAPGLVDSTESPASPLYVTGGRPTAPAMISGRKGIFDDMDSAVQAARAAYETLHWKLTLDTRRRIVAAMREATRRIIPELAHKAVEETGLGRVEDKLKKNTLVVEKTPGVEILEPNTYSGDDGLAIIERAPYGVIGAITPCTNPTETILNNGIGMVAGGNAVVFNVHPSAKGVCRYFVEVLNEAIVSAGGPENLLCAIANPTIESADALMKHPGIRLVVVTGGGGVVKAAMQSGKRAICAGPGNPPCVVDETADLDRAARGIIEGASIDNNIICTAEKETLVVGDVADALKRRLVDLGCYLVDGDKLARLEREVVTPDNHINRELIGKNASVILERIGVKVSGDPRLVIAEVDENHPFVQHEQMMPVHPIVRVRDADEGIEMARRVEHGYGHTAVMYSRDIEALHRMARVINCSIFVKNASNLAGLGFGGEGYTSFTIASPTGEGLTTARTFTRERRCTLKEYFRFV
jgi:aldehyde dehydrogenase